MGREFAYQAVYRYLETLITQTHPCGDARLPSLRDLSIRLQVSLATVQSAYSLLEREGRVVSVPRSGYFVHSRSGGGAVDASVSWAPGASFSLPSPCSPSLERALLAHERRLVRQAARLPLAGRVTGSSVLRNVLAARHTRSSSQYWNADDVHLATDVHALVQTLCAALALREATALVATPCCWRLLQALRQSGVRVVETPFVEHGGLDLAAIERALRLEPVQLILLPSCLGMPVGRLLPQQQLRELGRLLEHRPTWLLENDLDSEHCFSTPPARRLRDWVDPQRLLVLGSLDSVIGAEAPYAYVLGRHAQLREAVALRGFVLPPLRQQAVAQLFSRGDVDSHLLHLRGELAARMAQLCHEVARQLADYLAFEPPAGGRVLWCRLYRPVDARRLVSAMAGTALSIAPGDVFSLRGAYQHYVLLAWVGERPSELRQAIGKLGQVLAATAGSVPSGR